MQQQYFAKTKIKLCKCNVFREDDVKVSTGLCRYCICFASASAFIKYRVINIQGHGHSTQTLLSKATNRNRCLKQMLVLKKQNKINEHMLIFSIC